MLPELTYSHMTPAAAKKFVMRVRKARFHLHADTFLRLQDDPEAETATGYESRICLKVSQRQMAEVLQEMAEHADRLKKHKDVETYVRVAFDGRCMFVS
jgi:hypothetical protein